MFMDVLIKALFMDSSVSQNRTSQHSLLTCECTYNTHHQFLNFYRLMHRLGKSHYQLVMNREFPFRG